MKENYSIHHPFSSLEKITPNFVIFYISEEMNFRKLKTNFWKLRGFLNDNVIVLRLSIVWIRTWSHCVTEAQPLWRYRGPQVHFPAHNMAPGATQHGAGDEPQITKLLAHRVCSCWSPTNVMSLKYNNNQLWPSKHVMAGLLWLRTG